MPEFLFTNINETDLSLKSFREAYREIGKQVQNGTYKASGSKKHSHKGSKDNLAIEKIIPKKQEAKAS